MSNERQAAADYVAALSIELAHIAYRHGLDSTAYMLEIAAAEATSAKPNPANGARHPLDELVA
jgi:hypothetical protein